MEGFYAVKSIVKYEILVRSTTTICFAAVWEITALKVSENIQRTSCEELQLHHQLLMGIRGSLEEKIRIEQVLLSVVCIARAIKIWLGIESKKKMQGESAFKFYLF